jgi:hypothetical protein
MAWTVRAKENRKVVFAVIESRVGCSSCPSRTFGASVCACKALLVGCHASSLRGLWCSLAAGSTVFSRVITVKAVQHGQLFSALIHKKDVHQTLSTGQQHISSARIQHRGQRNAIRPAVFVSKDFYIFSQESQWQPITNLCAHG